MPARPPRPAEDPLRDVEGTPIPLQCRVEQVAVEEKQGALRCRLHQQGLVIGQGIHLLYVRFDHENHGMIALRPHLVRVLETPGHHRAPDTTRLPGRGTDTHARLSPWR